MDQPKPSSIAQLNEKLCPTIQKIMSLMRNKLLQNSSLQQSNHSSSTNMLSQKQTSRVNLNLSSDSSAASSPLSSSPPTSSTSSSFSLSTKSFQTQQQPSSSLSAINLGSLVNFNFSLATNAVLFCAASAASNNKRTKNNSQSKSNSNNNKNHSSNSILKSSSENESSTVIKTKKKKCAFKFDNRKYVRRSFTPMCELLQPVTVPSLDIRSSSDPSGSSIKRSHSFVVLENEKEINLDDFDQIKSHQTLELYEARIQMGCDDLHLHPALAIKAAEEMNCTVFSKEEVKRFDNYKQVNVYQPKPKFWPPRVWDNLQNDTQNDSSIKNEQNSCNQKLPNDNEFSNRPSELSEQQSEKLLNMIEESYKIPEIIVSYASKSSRTQKRKRAHRALSSSASVSRISSIKNSRNQKSPVNIAPSLINLYAINVFTDDSDLDTDFEDF
ncbi:hypothetical protein M9Y10_006039 [Tritrichomonas musculus]|uniref:Uncharacterized protein n=1 Tax=Tritrichomonas musculus TaxID=1915356 RepID=A0ABR2JDQ8_9EUKA